MSAPDTAARGRGLPLAPSRHGTIVVVGGGCYGAYYVRQLGRACRAGAVVADRVLVVDRDPSCRVARDGWDAQPGDAEGTGGGDAPGLGAGGPPRIQHAAIAGGEHHPLPALVVERADWREFFGEYLGRAATLPPAGDAIVPSPLMPHLMYEWLLARARARWPGRAVDTRPLPRAPRTPWERAAPDGTHYVSFADWMCPINCIEPARCPHTRGPRSWSLPPAVQAFARELGDEGHAVAATVILHCAHRAWGVGMFDVADVVAGDRTVAATGTAGPAAVLVGTVSHCHGALNLMSIGP